MHDATPIPNAAAQTAERIGIGAPAAFDLNAACAGFCYGVAAAADLVRAGPARTRWSSAPSGCPTGWTGTTGRPAIIFADGAGAAVVAPATVADAVGVGPVAWGSAGDMYQTIHINPEDARHQEGQAVFRWATTKIAPVALRAIELAGLTPADIDVFVPHQANLRIIEAVAKRLRAKGARDLEKRC